MTTDTHEMLNGGALVPLGDLLQRGGAQREQPRPRRPLSAVLSGASWGPFPPPFPAHLPPPRARWGRGWGALRGAAHARFIDPEEFRRQVDDWVRTKGHPPRRGHHRAR